MADSRASPPEILCYRFVILKGEHSEAAVISAARICGRSFPVAVSQVYYETVAESWPCCLSGLSDSEAEEEIRHARDDAFGVSHWVEAHRQRFHLTKPDSISCKDWKGEGLWSQEHRFEYWCHATTEGPQRRCPEVAAPRTAVNDEPEPIDQNRAKRRRVDDVPGNESTDDGSRNSDEDCPPDPDMVTVFVDRFVAKVRGGLKKLQKNSRKSESSARVQESLGVRLLRHRQSAADDNGEKLEALLEVYSGQQKSDAWLSEIFHRFVRFRRRNLDPAYSQTGDIHQEHHVKEKEGFCKVTSAVVNGLEVKWGPLASFVYSALEETKFRACMLYRGSKQGVSPKDYDRAADLIIKVLSDVKEIIVSRSALILNPIFFISCVQKNVLFPDACKGTCQASLAKYDLQSTVDERAARLEELGLECGKMPLSSLLQFYQGRVEERPELGDGMIAIFPLSSGAIPRATSNNGSRLDTTGEARIVGSPVTPSLLACAGDRLCDDESGEENAHAELENDGILELPASDPPHGGPTDLGAAASQLEVEPQALGHGERGPPPISDNGEGDLPGTEVVSERSDPARGVGRYAQAPILVSESSSGTETCIHCGSAYSCVHEQDSDTIPAAGASTLSDSRVTPPGGYSWPNTRLTSEAPTHASSLEGARENPWFHSDCNGNTQHNGNGTTTKGTGGCEQRGPLDLILPIASPSDYSFAGFSPTPSPSRDPFMGFR